MTQETEREAFEKAAKLEGLNVARHRIGHDDYDCDNTQWRWLGFKHGLMQARARVGKGEVETHITDMAIAHDMSHTAFCDEGHWRDEFIAAKEKAIAGLSSKPVEADTELTRLKRQVEVLSRGLRGLRETTTDNISEVRAENALAAADRIAKGEV